ncbi:uncharacterized protein [Clytia hemisphaerica]|uniref:uncharacterized protein isoform X2 n=1 Tax=Clytia hemisphaerica TaxID=252671 RepID=UPI0034D52DA9
MSADNFFRTSFSDAIVVPSNMSYMEIMDHVWNQPQQESHGNEQLNVQQRITEQQSNVSLDVQPRTNVNHTLTTGNQPVAITSDDTREPSRSYENTCNDLRNLLDFSYNTQPDAPRPKKKKRGPSKSTIQVKLYHLPGGSEKPSFSNFHDPVVVRHCNSGYGYAPECYDTNRQKIKKMSLQLCLTEQQLKDKMHEIFKKLTSPFYYYKVSQSSTILKCTVSKPLDLDKYQGVIVVSNDNNLRFLGPSRRQQLPLRQIDLNTLNPLNSSTSSLPFSTQTSNPLTNNLTQAVTSSRSNRTQQSMSSTPTSFSHSNRTQQSMSSTLTSFSRPNLTQQSMSSTLTSFSRPNLTPSPSSAAHQNWTSGTTSSSSSSTTTSNLLQRVTTTQPISASSIVVRSLTSSTFRTQIQEPIQPFTFDEDLDMSEIEISQIRQRILLKFYRCLEINIRRTHLFEDVIKIFKEMTGFSEIKNEQIISPLLADREAQRGSIWQLYFFL